MENQFEFVNITIQDETGDRKLCLTWDTGDSEGAKLAQQQMKVMFEDLQKNGFRFFTCKKILGIFPKKGREVKYYDAELGELFYETPDEVEKQEIIEEKKTRFHEIDDNNTKVKYEEPNNFDPKVNEVNTERNYVATCTLRAG